MKFTDFGFDAALESTLDGFENDAAVLESFNNFAALMEDNANLAEDVATEGTGKFKANAQIFWQTLKDFIGKAISSIRELLKKIGIVSSYKNVGKFVENFSKMAGQASKIFQKANDLLGTLASGKAVNLLPLSEMLGDFTQMKADLYNGIKEADAEKAGSASNGQFKQFGKVCEQTTNALQTISGKVDTIAKNVELSSNGRVQANASSIVKMCTQVSNTLSACYQYGSKKCAAAVA